MQVSFNSSASGMSNISTLSQEITRTSINQIEQEISAIDKQLSQLSATNDNMNHSTEIGQLTKQRETLQKQLDSLKDTSSTANANNTSQVQNANEKQPQTKEEADSMKAFGRAYDTTISPQSYTAMQTEQKSTKQTSEQQLLKKMTL